MMYTRSSNSPLPSDRSDWTRQLPADGSFDVASSAGWFARRAMQADPDIERNLRSTVRGLVGSGFTAQEIDALEKRALDKVEWDELNTLRGIEAGVPVELNPRQRTKIEGLLNRMGDDPLARRARDAFVEGLTSGKIRVR